MKFIEVAPEDIPNIRESHRGRVSYPILKSFMELGKPLCELDRTGIQQSYQSLYSSLTAYIKSHQLPIKLFSRSGKLYLLRLDLDDQGNEVEWTPENSDPGPVDMTASLISSDEVAARAAQEKERTTK